MKRTLLKARESSVRVIGLGVLLGVMLAASGTHRLAAASKSAGSAPARQVAVLTSPWTAVASTGAVDEGSVAFFGTTGPSFGFKGANGNLVQARYNVTNTYDNNTDPDLPGWGTLELTSTIPAGGGMVNATLFQVEPCTGITVPLCVATNQGDPEHPEAICTKCTFANLIDFGTYVYYVDLKVQRNMAVLPSAQALRIY